MAEIDDLKARIRKLEKDLLDAKKSKLRSDSAKDLNDLGTISDLVETLNKQYQVTQDTLENLGATGAFFVKGGPLQQGLENSIASLNKMLAEPKLGAQAFAALNKEIINFQQIAKATQDSTGNLAGELTKQAAVLEKLGLSYGSFSKNVDFAIYSMGASQDQVKALNSSLVELSQAVGMLPDQMARNFQSVSKNLAYNFNEIKNQFVKIQQLSNETGVSIDNLMGKFGTPMDTISGASQMAAKLNSLLGRNRFSATELLMMTEEDRMTQIRGALMEGGLATTALAGGVQGKFALQSVQEVLGMGLDDTRRFLQTGGLKGELAGQVGRDFTGGEGSAGGEAKKFVDATDKSAKSLEDFRDQILSLRDPLEALAIRMRGAALARPDPLQRGMQTFGTLKDVGFLTGLDQDFIGAAQKSPEFRRLLEMQRQDQSMMEETELKSIAQSINRGEVGARDKAARALSGMSATQKNLSQVDYTLIDLARRRFPVGGFPEILTNFLRGNSQIALDLEGMSPEELTDPNGIINKIKAKIMPAGLEEEMSKLGATQGLLQGTTVPATRSTVPPGLAGSRTGGAGSQGVTEVYQIFVGNEKIEEILKSQFKRVSPKSSGGGQ